LLSLPPLSPRRLTLLHPTARDLASGSYGIDYVKKALKQTFTLLARTYTSLPASPDELDLARNQPSALRQVGIEISAQVLERRAVNRLPGTEEALDKVEGVARKRGEVLDNMKRGREQALVEKRERERILTGEKGWRVFGQSWICRGRCGRSWRGRRRRGNERRLPHPLRRPSSRLTFQLSLLRGLPPKIPPKDPSLSFVSPLAPTSPKR
jgi:hypothetical protein